MIRRFVLSINVVSFDLSIYTDIETVENVNLTVWNARIGTITINNASYLCACLIVEITFFSRGTDALKYRYNYQSIV